MKLLYIPIDEKLLADFERYSYLLNKAANDEISDYEKSEKEALGSVIVAKVSGIVSYENSKQKIVKEIYQRHQLKNKSCVIPESE